MNRYINLIIYFVIVAIIANCNSKSLNFMDNKEGSDHKSKCVEKKVEDCKKCSELATYGYTKNICPIDYKKEYKIPGIINNTISVYLYNKEGKDNDCKPNLPSNLVHCSGNYRSYCYW